MKNHKNYIFSLIFFSSFLIYSCSSTKYVGDGQFLLKRERIKCHNAKLDNEALFNILLQKPNNKILGIFPLHLWIYNSYKPDKNSRFKKKAGEPPVIFDQNKSEESVTLLNKYLHNKGYLNSMVAVKKKERKKKISVLYKINPNEPYIIGTVKTDSKVAAFAELLKEKESSIDKLSGKNFDIDKLNKVRQWLSRYFENNGYYNFSADDIIFLADSSGQKNLVNLTVVAKKSSKSAVDNTVKYYMKDIYVNQTYSVRGNYNENMDTLNYEDKIYFIVPKSSKPLIRPKILAHCLSLEKEQEYQLSDNQNSYDRLSALNTFSYINMDFYPPSETSRDSLNCLINLSMLKTKSFAVQAEGTNSGGYLGVQGNVSFQSINTFRGAEKLSLIFNGGIEIQPLNTNNGEGKIINQLPFNTIEYGPEISLDFPRFLLPVKLERFSKSGNPHTLIDLQYNYQFRPDYNRKLASANFSYKWNETKTKRHIITPIALSYININPSQEFTNLLNEINDPFVYSSYQDHLILASQYSFILNTQGKRSRNRYYFRFNLESAGNLLNLYSSSSNQPRDTDGTYKVFGIQYAQYVRSDIDFRYYHSIKKSEIATRFIAGVGVPYGNSATLPYSRSFYAGGANDIRAWRVRTLGPGSLNDSIISSQIDQMGDMQLEASAEYRFNIFKFIDGAFFLDAGNIWLLKKDPQKPNAEFNIGRLWQDVAIGSGFGIRLDFSYFLLRFDLGLKLKDPGSNNPKQIKPNFHSMPLNIGIGYPF